MNASRAVSLLSFTVTLLSCAAIAQEFTRAEIGAETSILLQNRILSHTDVGIGGRFTYNFTPSVALESEVDSYLTNTNTVSKSLQDGGRAFVGLIGPKAGIRRDRFGVFFKARAGVMSFSNVLTSSAVFGSSGTARKTHAALDLGVATEFYPSSRTILRFDAGRMLVRYGDATDAVLSGGITARSTGQIVGPWHMEIGAGYRLGSLREDRETAPVRQRFEAGVLYSLFSSERGLNIVRDESGAGGWFTWNFSKYFGLDASTTFFPRMIHLADFQQGGRMFQVLAGVRGGIRRGRIGIFGKFRPGIQRYSTTEMDNFRNAPFTDMALDAGGIIEFYSTRHSVFRFDAGNTRIHYRGKDIGTPSGTFHAPAFTNNTIQLSVGLGFRF